MSDNTMWVIVDGVKVRRKIDHIDPTKPFGQHMVPVILDSEMVVWEIGSFIPKIVKVR